MAKKVTAFRAQFTRFERARIVGSRALQIAMGAPIIAVDPILDKTLDPVRIAEFEYSQGLIPITVIRPEEGQARPRKRPEIRVTPKAPAGAKKEPVAPEKGRR